jgi:hypothetical protein
MEAAGVVDLCYEAVVRGAVVMHTDIVADSDNTMECKLQAIDLTEDGAQRLLRLPTPERSEG